MKTEVMSFTMSKSFTIFNDLKIGLVCSVKDGEKRFLKLATKFSLRSNVIDSSFHPQPLIECCKTSPTHTLFST